jgi:hypothetical protein
MAGGARQGFRGANGWVRVRWRRPWWSRWTGVVVGWTIRGARPRLAFLIDGPNAGSSWRELRTTSSTGERAPWYICLAARQAPVLCPSPADRADLDLDPDLDLTLIFTGHVDAEPAPIGNKAERKDSRVKPSMNQSWTPRPKISPCHDSLVYIRLIGQVSPADFLASVSILPCVNSPPFLCPPSARLLARNSPNGSPDSSLNPPCRGLA